MQILLAIGCVLFSLNAMTQVGLGETQDIESNDSLVVSEEAYLAKCETNEIVDRKTCTEESLLDYMMSELSFPNEATADGVHQFQLTAEFIIDTSGLVSEIKVLDENPKYGVKEVKTWLRSCPRWMPARNNGTAIKTKYTIPVYFNDQW